MDDQDQKPMFRREKGSKKIAPESWDAYANVHEEVRHELEWLVERTVQVVEHFAAREGIEGLPNLLGVGDSEHDSRARAVLARVYAEQECYGPPGMKTAESPFARELRCLIRTMLHLASAHELAEVATRQAAKCEPRGRPRLFKPAKPVNYLAQSLGVKAKISTRPRTLPLTDWIISKAGLEAQATGAQKKAAFERLVRTYLESKGKHQTKGAVDKLTKQVQDRWTRLQSKREALLQRSVEWTNAIDKGRGEEG